LPGFLNIAIVTETYPPEVNGVAMTLGKLAEGLQSLGHSVQVYRPRQSAGDRATCNGTFAEHLLPGMRVPMYRELRLGFPAFGHLQRAWNRRRPDVVYVATEGPLGWSAIRAAGQLDIPALSGFHTNFHTYSRHYRLGWLEPLILRYLRNLHRSTHCTLVPTQALAGRLRARGFGRVEVLQRGVDTTLFSPQRRNAELRSQWGAGDNDLVCLYVGRIAAEKNIQEAVTTVRAIQSQQPNVRFVLVGDGPMRKSLARSDPDFVFCGTRRGEELAQHYASGDVFLFPSRSETFGNVVTEAMASGLAVVAYNEAAAGEHIRNNQTGVLVDGAVPAAFHDAARALCSEPHRVHELGTNAARYVGQLDWSSVVRRFAFLLGEQKGVTGDESNIRT
jgi:glycosyltransferase involved in cell wall biosynthesis